MLICHRHRFIFLKTQKTAGTAVEIALRGLMGPGDVITPISREDERLSRTLGRPGPRGFRAPLRDYNRRDLLRLLGQLKLKKRFYNHIPAAAVRALVPEAIWNDYRKISIERNPFDKAISSYYWRTRKQAQPPSLTRWLQQCPVSEISNWPVYTIDDALVTDVMLRHEQLDQDLQQLSSTLGLPQPLTLPVQRPKGQVRRDRRPWQEVLDAAGEALIRQVCAREIAALGY